MKTCKCEHWQQCPVCMPHRFDSDGNLLPPEPTPLQAARQEAESLRQQLAAALAAIKVKDAALQSAISAHKYESGDLHDALAIQPDDSALKVWLGDPVGEVKRYTGSLKDMAIIVWTGKQPEEGTKLYSPKGLK